MATMSVCPMRCRGVFADLFLAFTEAEYDAGLGGEATGALIRGCYERDKTAAKGHGAKRAAEVQGVGTEIIEG
jgi:hypothetical protein